MRKKLGMGVLFVIGFALCCLPIIWNVIEQRHQSDAVATYQNAVSKKDDTKLKEIMEMQGHIMICCIRQEEQS